MLKADTFALVKTKNLPPCGGFFCTTPAFIPLGAKPVTTPLGAKPVFASLIGGGGASIYPAWRRSQYLSRLAASPVMTPLDDEASIYPA